MPGSASRQMSVHGGSRKGGVTVVKRKRGRAGSMPSAGARVGFQAAEHTWRKG